MKSVTKILAEEALMNAEAGFEQALSDPESPQEAAIRLRKARMFDVSPEEAPTVTKEEEAQARARAVNWAAMYTEAPTLVERLSQPAFANLVKDDLSSMTTMEGLLWKLSPEKGEKDDTWGAVRNAFSRGGFMGQATWLGGSLAAAEGYHKELDRVRQIEKEIDEGKDVSHYFVTAEDETGRVGLAAFLADKERIKANLEKSITEEAQATARRVRFASAFPESKELKAMMDESSFAGAVRQFAGSPVKLLAELGTSSLMQNAPNLLALPALGAVGGLPAQVAGTFAFSAGSDKNAQLMEYLSDEGIDLTDASAIAKAYADPTKRDMLVNSLKRAERHAIGTAMFDALSVGVASKTLIPKSATRKILDSAYKREFANLALQTEVQGALGMAGEATGQLMADGEISSFADILAEGVGEHFSGPIEVYTTGMDARLQVIREKERATRKAEILSQLKGLQTQAGALDPESMAQFQGEVAKRAKVENVAIEAESFHQMGLEHTIADSPELMQRYQEALATGGSFEVPMTQFINDVLPKDKDDQILGITSVGGTPSVTEVTETESALNEQAQAEVDIAEREATRAFNAEVAEVGRSIGHDLQAMGVLRDEARNIQAIVQLNVANMARQAGVSPKAVWEKYGARYLGEPDITRTKNGVEVRAGVLSEGNNPAGESFSQESKGDYFPSLRVIARWRGADRSTLLHETGHMFLDMRMRLASDMMDEMQTYAQEHKGETKQLTEAQAKYVVASLEVLSWLGVKSMDAWNAMSAKEQETYHEKFARTFEAYVMKGEAPTPKLERVFREFAKWLKDIYSVIANVPGAELTDDVQAMFDAMFASEEEIRTARARQAVQPLFADANMAGMSATEWAEYQEAQDSVVEQAEGELRERNIRLQKSVSSRRRSLLRALRSERRGKVAEIRSKVEKAYKDSKVYNAWSVLVHGHDVDGKTVRLKLNFEDLKMLGYNDKQIEALHKARLASPRKSLQPMPMYDLAQALGYANENELVDDLLANLDPEEVIDRLTAERLLEESPDLANEKTMQDAADAALFNEAKGKVVSTELNAMERAFGAQSRTEAKAIDAIAYQAIQAMKVADVKPIVFVRAANRAARNARKAWAKGAIKEAITFKRQELYQTALAKHARETLIYFGKETKGFKKFKAKQIKELDTEILVLIQRALANMGFFTEKDLHLNEATESFADELRTLQEELGYGIAIGGEALRAITERDVSFLSTVDGLRSFIDAINTLEAQARREKTIDTISGKKELEEVMAETATAVRENALKKGRDVLVQSEGVGLGERFKDTISKLGLIHARAAALIATLDGSWTGKLTELLVYPSDKCGNTEETLKHKYAKRVHDILKPVEKSLFDVKARTSKVFNHAFTTQQVFVLLLNYGNDGNRQRALSTIMHHTGVRFFDGVDPKNKAAMAQAQARADAMMRALFAEYLTDEHYTAAEQIWATFEDIKTLTGQTQRHIVGREPEWVEATPLVVDTPNGPRKLTGGYYPIAYDRKASLMGKGVAEADTFKSLQPLFGKGGVADGWTKSRAKIVTHAPLVLTSRAMFDGLDEQIHYIAWAGFINDARKLLDPRGALAKAIADHYGTDYFKALQQWLEDCRDGNRGQTTTSDILANAIRRNVSLAGIGLNLGTAALQLVGITQSIAYLGGKWAGKGVSEFLTMGPMKSFKVVSEKSEMMASRMRTQFRELTEVQARLNGTTGNLRDKFMRAAYLPLTIVQMAVDLPTWLGAYQKALFEGKDEYLAVSEADRAVMNSQGSGRMQDLSQIERGNAYQKLLTVFYTFFNTAYNLAWVSGKTQQGLKRATTLMTILVLQPVIESFLRSAIDAAMDDDDNDDWLEKAIAKGGKDVVGFNLGLFVGLRELNAVLDEYGYRGPAGFRAISDTIRAGRSWKTAVEKGEVSESTLKATVSAVGVWAGLPVTPINRAISGANALRNDETDNPAVLLMGYSHQK